MNFRGMLYYSRYRETNTRNPLGDAHLQRLPEICEGLLQLANLMHLCPPPPLPQQKRCTPSVRSKAGRAPQKQHQQRGKLRGKLACPEFKKITGQTWFTYVNSPMLGKLPHLPEAQFYHVKNTLRVFCTWRMFICVCGFFK